MPRSDQASTSTYTPTARALHWLTAAAVFILIPVGIVMTSRGEANIWDATTNNLYSLHKGLGFLVLLLIIWRLVYRVSNGAPPDEPTLTELQRKGSHGLHWALYALLLMVPVGGWIGVSLYDARGVFGVVSLPQITPVNQDLAGKVFFVHKLGGIAILALALGHIGAALFHHFVRKDGVLRRMLPAKSPK
jgi:cytochrome b561